MTTKIENEIENEIDSGPKTLTFILPKERTSNSGILPIDDSLIPSDGISFYVMRLGKVIVIHAKGDFFIGRSVDEDSWNPEVNLAEQDGFASSVSRRHARISPLNHGYEITDLHSRNGTMLDDWRLLPNKPYPLASGVQLSVGREQLMVIYRPPGFYK
jgi:pSer/pThr/pTyr-binding forkhead associated (FHA) protein